MKNTTIIFNKEKTVKKSKAKDIKEFYTTIMNLTGGCMPCSVTESLLECFIYDDEDSWDLLIHNLCELYKLLPSGDFKGALDFYIETLASV